MADEPESTDEDIEKVIALCEERDTKTIAIEKALARRYWEKREAGHLIKKKSLWQQWVEYLQGLFTKTPAR